MAKPKTVPRFASHEEAATWLDTHSTAYVVTTPGEFELGSDFRVRVVHDLGKKIIDVDHALSKQISQIAQRQGLTIDVLVKRWLKEKIVENKSWASA